MDCMADVVIILVEQVGGIDSYCQSVVFQERTLQRESILSPRTLIAIYIFYGMSRLSIDEGCEAQLPGQLLTAINVVES